MKFLQALVENETSRHLKNRPYDQDYKYRQYKPIQINENLWFSIQASYAHYCTPRTTMEYLEEYTHMEIALFDKDNFVSVSDVLPDFFAKAEIEYYFEGQVYPYVPVDLIESLYLALKK